MGISLAEQWLLLFWGSALGVVLGAMRTVFRSVRILCGISPFERRAISKLSLPLIKDRACRIKPSVRSRFLRAAWVFGEDVSFFLVSAVLFRIYLYLVADGAFRFFALVGVAGGFLAYRFTLGKVMALCLEYILFGVRVAFFYACYVLFFPFRFVGKRLLCRWWRAREIAYHREYMRKTLRAVGGAWMKDADILGE